MGWIVDENADNGNPAADAINSGAAADPVSAVAGALGGLFGLFGQISAQTQSEKETQAALLLASQPKKDKKVNTELYLFIGALVLLALIIILKLLL